MKVRARTYRWLTGISRQLDPHLVMCPDRLFLGWQPIGEQHQSLTQPCGGWGDETVISELVSYGGDVLTGQIRFAFVGLRMQLLHCQTSQNAINGGA